MAHETPRRQTEAIALSARAPRRFLLFHGYTGSPANFNDLPRVLHARFGANVEVPLLPGHGTALEHLYPLTLSDFLAAAEAPLVSALARGERVVVGGHSFGAQLALLLAARHPVAGLLLSGIPYRFRFPMSIRLTHPIFQLRRAWQKRLSPEERAIRENDFFYPAMPARGLSLVTALNDLITAELGAVRCPTLLLHSVHDRIAHPKSSVALAAAIGASTAQLAVNHQSHSTFFGAEHGRVGEAVVEFFTRHRVFG